MIKIIIAKDFSETPGGREYKDGPYSGLEFREKILEEKYEQCKKSGEKLYIDFDGTFGYPPSFLDEAFGGLSSKCNHEGIFNIIDVKSEDQPGIQAAIEEKILKRKKAGI